MPYIPGTQREDIHVDLRDLGLDFTPENAGELNYMTSEFVNNYLNTKGLSYANLNEMMGALECCKLELYRMIGALYEDAKALENGSVYTALDRQSDSY